MRLRNSRCSFQYKPISAEQLLATRRIQFCKPAIQNPRPSTITSRSEVIPQGVSEGYGVLRYDAVQFGGKISMRRSAMLPPSSESLSRENPRIF